MFCRLQVAGCGLKFNYNWKTAGTQMKRTSGRLTVTVTWPFFDRTVRLLPPYAKPSEAMGGKYIAKILSLQWIIGFEKTSETSSEIAAEFGLFPVSTKMKARWACANPFRRLKSYMSSFRYLFGNFLLLREDPSQIWNRWKHLWSGHSDGFEEISLVSACRSILNYFNIAEGINNLTLKEGDTNYYGKRECSS